MHIIFCLLISLTLILDHARWVNLVCVRRRLCRQRLQFMFNTVCRQLLRLFFVQYALLHLWQKTHEASLLFVVLVLIELRCLHRSMGLSVLHLLLFLRLFARLLQVSEPLANFAFFFFIRIFLHGHVDVFRGFELAHAKLFGFNHRRGVLIKQVPLVYNVIMGLLPLILIGRWRFELRWLCFRCQLLSPVVASVRCVNDTCLFFFLGLLFIHVDEELIAAYELRKLPVASMLQNSDLRVRPSVWIQWFHFWYLGSSHSVVVSGTAIAQIDCIVERDTSNYVLTWLEAEVCTIAAPHVFLLTQALQKRNSLVKASRLGAFYHIFF